MMGLFVHGWIGETLFGEVVMSFAVLDAPIRGSVSERPMTNNTLAFGVLNGVFCCFPA